MKLLFLAAFLAATCQTGPFPPQPNPDPVPFPPEPMGGAAPVVVADAGPAFDTDPSVRAACDNLAALHCVEGMVGCYRVLQRALDTRVTLVPLACLVGASSKSDVRACGPFVACP